MTLTISTFPSPPYFLYHIRRLLGLTHILRAVVQLSEPRPRQLRPFLRAFAPSDNDIPQSLGQIGTTSYPTRA